MLKIQMFTGAAPTERLKPLEDLCSTDNSTFFIYQRHYTHFLIRSYQCEVIRKNSSVIFFTDEKYGWELKVLIITFLIIVLVTNLTMVVRRSSTSIVSRQQRGSLTTNNRVAHYSKYTHLCLIVPPPNKKDIVSTVARLFILRYNKNREVRDLWWRYMWKQWK